MSLVAWTSIVLAADRGSVCGHIGSIRSWSRRATVDSPARLLTVTAVGKKAC
ncbi:MAG TPA: hypothetical protein VE011_04395 [Candidatus Dormibacteraeota bacterium]|nr:hypothetical protein [Candidatus Dormibacteraeota bacterium]